MNLKRTTYLALLACLIAVATSCNKDKDDTTSSSLYTTSNTSALVTSFSLKANTSVMSGLDSVYFTIDPERALIYNADSLPKGTNVSRLLTSLTFYTQVQEATYIAEYTKDGVSKTDSIKYSDTSTDSINFTGKVTLKVVSYNGNKTMNYTVKVNVHQVEPDTLVWNPSKRRDLPGSGNNNLAQRTVKRDDRYYCLLQTSQAYRISKAPDPEGPWVTTDINWGFVPAVETFAATDNAFYVLDTEGNLHTSPDLAEWTATGNRWRAIVGSYDNRVLGITAGEAPKHDEYPAPAGFAPTQLEADFPVSGFSQLIHFSGEWSSDPQALMMGGTLADGKLSNLVWGYDGTNWGIISGNRNALPALRDATLVPYVSYTINALTSKVTRYATWLVIGGFTSTGAANRDTYQSTNNGIVWTKAASGLQLPSYLPNFGRAQAFVVNRTLPAASGAPRRVKQDPATWPCPYIYLFGGVNENGVLQNNVWTGVLTRLTFKPLY